jgi:hypothetical protein
MGGSSAKMKAKMKTYPTPSLERLERVMEGIPREESTPLPSSNDSKQLGKEYPGENSPNSLPRMTQKSYGRNSQGRICPTPLLERLGRVMKGIPKEPDYPPYGVSDKIRIRIRIIKSF